MKLSNYLRLLRVPDWALISLLILLQIIYFNLDPLEFSMHDEKSRWSFSKQITLALGLEIGNVYPYFSEQVFYDFSDLSSLENPDLLDLNLLQHYRDFPWNETGYLPFGLQGGDIGTLHLIDVIWKLTGQYNIRTIQAFYILIHLIAICTSFLTLRFFCSKLISFLGVLVFSFSPMLKHFLQSGMHYTTTVYASIFVTFLLVFLVCSLNKSNWSSKLPTKIYIASVVLGILVVVSTELRGSCLILIYVSGLVLFLSVLKRFRLSKLIIFSLFLVSAALTRLTIDLTLWKQNVLNANLTRGHVVIHSVWAGLGQFPNPYGFVWNDGGVRKYVASVDPSVTYLSKEYNKILLNHISVTIKHNPIWYVSVLGKRFVEIGEEWKKFLPLSTFISPTLSMVVMIILVLYLIYILFFQFKITLLAFFLPCFSFFGEPILIYSSYDMYNLASYTAIWLVAVFALDNLVKTTIQIRQTFLS